MLKLNVAKKEIGCECANIYQGQKVFLAKLLQSASKLVQDFLEHCLNSMTVDLQSKVRIAQNFFYFPSVHILCMFINWPRKAE